MTTIESIRIGTGVSRKSLQVPQVPRKAKTLFHGLVEASKLRVKFAELWITRGLGIRRARTLDPALLNDGLTLVLPGIESESVFTYGLCAMGLHEGGVKGAIRVFNWGLPFPGVSVGLTRVDRTRRRAHDVAARVVAYQDQYPGRPVYLVAQSGGAGVAVFAAEELPEGRMVEGDCAFRAGRCRRGATWRLRRCGSAAEGVAQLAFGSGHVDIELGDAAVRDGGPGVHEGGGVRGVSEFRKGFRRKSRQAVRREAASAGVVRGSGGELSTIGAGICRREGKSTWRSILRRG